MRRKSAENWISQDIHYRICIGHNTVVKIYIYINDLGPAWATRPPAYVYIHSRPQMCISKAYTQMDTYAPSSLLWVICALLCILRMCAPYSVIRLSSGTYAWARPVSPVYGVFPGCCGARGGNRGGPIRYVGRRNA